MRLYKKCLVVIFFSVITISLYAQKDSGNVITVKLDKSNTVQIQMPQEKHNFLQKYIIPNFPGFAILATLIGLWIQTAARRREEKRKNHLDRISKQISELYMPLHALYEKGDKNWYSFKDLYGEPTDFDNANYADWAYLVFKNTNAAMREIITKKADLIIGSKIPKCLLDFSAWADAFEIYLHAYEKKNFNNRDWDNALKGHPEVEMQAYLSACVEVLKKHQNLLLTGKKTSVDETKLNKQVNELIAEHREQIINHPYRKGVWERAAKREQEKQQMQNNQAADTPTKAHNYKQYISTIAFIMLMRFLINRKKRHKHNTAH